MFFKKNNFYTQKCNEFHKEYSFKRDYDNNYAESSHFAANNVDQPYVLNANLCFTSILLNFTLKYIYTVLSINMVAIHLYWLLSPSNIHDFPQARLCSGFYNLRLECHLAVLSRV